jgi:ribosomal protein S27E
MNPGNEVRKAKTKLDEVLEEKETRAAIRYSAAEMEKMAIESENEAARLRGEPPRHKYHGGDEMSDEDKEKKKQEEAEQKAALLTSATSLINSGLDPKQVGQMLMGLNPTPATMGYAPAQGMGFDEVMKMITFIVGKKETDELKGIIASLDKRLDDLSKVGTGRREEARPIDPITFAKQQAEAVAAWHEAIQVIIPKPGPVSDKGEPIEVVKERNRHDEKMEEIKGDLNYKKSLTDIATDIPERIGRGIAGRFAEEEESVGMGSSVSSKGNSSLEHIVCADCGFKIQVPPNAGKEIECPKCGAVYTKQETGAKTE